MKKHLLPLALLLSGISPAQALDVGDISSFMNSDSSTLSKTIKNSEIGVCSINLPMREAAAVVGKIVPHPHHTAEEEQARL